MCLAQVKSTTVKGKIADATTGEALPFVQVYFDGTQIGTTTDIDGRYLLKNENGYVTVMFKMVGYKTEVKSVQYGTNAILNVEMRPTATQLTEVTIRPKERKRERYRRRDNPAVELARNVIQHKWENRVESNAAYTRRQYRKVTLALDNFDPDYNISRLWTMQFSAMLGCERVHLINGPADDVIMPHTIDISIRFGLRLPMGGSKLLVSVGPYSQFAYACPTFGPNNIEDPFTRQINEDGDMALNDFHSGAFASLGVETQGGWQLLLNYSLCLTNVLNVKSQGSYILPEKLCLTFGRRF